MGSLRVSHRNEVEKTFQTEERKTEEMDTEGGRPVHISGNASDSMKLDEKEHRELSRPV